MTTEQKPASTRDYAVAAATQGKSDGPKGLPPSTPAAAKGKAEAKKADPAEAAEKAKAAQIKLGTGMQKIGSRIAGYFNTGHKQVADAKPAGPMQYRLMSVPSPNTQLNLGEWVKNPALADIGAAFGYPGYSVTTAASHFSNVGGTSVFQGKGDVTQQSVARWTQFSQAWDASVLKRATLTSGESILIGAGTTTLSDLAKGLIPVAGAALKPPQFDASKLHTQVLDHASDSLNYVLKSTVTLSKARRELGMPMMPVPELTVWQLLGLALHKATKKIQEAREKLAKIEAKLKAAADKAHAANDWLKKNSGKIEAANDAFWNNMATAAPWTGMMIEAGARAQAAMEAAVAGAEAKVAEALGSTALIAAMPALAMPDVAGAVGAALPGGMSPGDLDALPAPVGLGVDSLPGGSLVDQAHDAATQAQTAAQSAGGMADAARGAVSQAQGAVSRVQGAVGQAQGLARDIAAAPGQALDQARGLASGAVNQGVGALNQATGGAVGQATNAVNQATSAVGQATNVANQAASAASGLAGAAGNPLGAVAGAAGAAGNALNSATGAVGNAANAAGSAANAASNAAGAASNAASNAAGLVSGAGSRVTDAIANAGGAGGLAKKLAGAVADKLASPPYAQKIGKAVQDATELANKHIVSKYQKDLDAKGDPAEFKVRSLDIQKDTATFLATTNQMLDEGERLAGVCKAEYDTLKPHIDKLSDFVQKAKDAKLDADGDGHISMKEALAAMEGVTAGAAMALDALVALTQSISKVLDELAKSLDNIAMNLLAEANKARIFLSAADNIEVGSSKKIHLYAVNGVDLDTDKGGFRAQTAQSIALRTQDMGEFLAEKHLWLEGLKGAELTSKGPTVLASRQGTAEVLGKTVRVGALESSATGRNKNAGDLGGGYAEGKQHTTELVHALATDRSIVQVGGKSPDGDKPTIAQDTPFYLSADKEGKVEIHAKDGGHLRLQVGKYVIQVKDDAIMVGLASSPTGEPEARLLIHESGDIAIETKQHIVLENKGNRFGFNESDSAWVLPGSSTKIEMAKSGVKVKGTKINLG